MRWLEGVHTCGPTQRPSVDVDEGQQKFQDQVAVAHPYYEERAFVRVCVLARRV